MKKEEVVCTCAEQCNIVAIASIIVFIICIVFIIIDSNKKSKLGMFNSRPF